MDPCSMVLGQFFCRFTGSAAQTHSAGRPQLVSKKFLEEEIFASWLLIAKIAKNFCLAKISRYTVLNLNHGACQFVFASPSSQLLATLDVHHCPANYGHLDCWLYCICIITPPVAGYITFAVSHHKLSALYMTHHRWPIAS